jgi:hypothetical protein
METTSDPIFIGLTFQVVSAPNLLLTVSFGALIFLNETCVLTNYANFRAPNLADH